LEKQVKIRIDDDVYRYLDDNGADINKIMQIFANQLNYYLNDQLSVYAYLREIKTSEVFYAIAERLKIEEEAVKDEEGMNVKKDNGQNERSSQRNL